MRDDIKKLWVDALRSGEYKQTQRTLCDGTGYCCLGVLAHILPEKELSAAGVTVREDSEEMAIEYRTEGDDGFEDEHIESNELPSTLRDHIGLTSKQMSSLMYLNDGRDAFEHPGFFSIEEIRPRTFAEIADYIEKEL